MKNKEKILDFMEELQTLCDKYKMYISGCGCCDSPYLVEEPKEMKIDYELTKYKDEYSVGCICYE